MGNDTLGYKHYDWGYRKMAADIVPLLAVT